MRVAILCGVTLAFINFFVLSILVGAEASVAAVICITLLVTVTVAKIVGCVLPMVASKIGFDPAVMASPFITTIIDAVSLMIYVNIAMQIL